MAQLGEISGRSSSRMARRHSFIAEDGRPSLIDANGVVGGWAVKDGRDLLIDLPFVLVTALSFISHQSSVILDGERRVIHKESNHTLAPCGFDGETRARIEFMANLGDPTPDALRRRR
eukprot:scaffold27135_cov23-Tisochrysis_lutea.AAC.1